MQRYTCLSLVALGLLLTAGCAKEPMGRVFGKVTFEGEPLDHGLVMFANREKGVYMTAKIEPNGEYLVEMAQGIGLPLGDYQVAVSPPPIDHPIGPILNPPKLEDEPQFPPLYRSFETSPLTMSVKSGKNEYNIALTRPKK